MVIGVLFATNKLSSKNGDNKETANKEINVKQNDDVEPENIQEETNTNQETNIEETNNQAVSDTPISSDVSFKWPTVGYTIVTYYGNRESTFGESSFHSGIDIAGEEGTAVYASAAGTIVSLVDYGTSGYGKSILINHNNGYYTLYGQLSGYAEGLTEGMTVTSGQLIGYIGSTGWASGSHLHFEIRNCIEYSCTVDPMTFLNQ